jgi:hypothetical protein
VVDLVAENIADRTNNQVAFGIDFTRSVGFFNPANNGFS